MCCVAALVRYYYRIKQMAAVDTRRHTVMVLDGDCSIFSKFSGEVIDVAVCPLNLYRGSCGDTRSTRRLLMGTTVSLYVAGGFAASWRNFIKRQILTTTFFWARWLFHATCLFAGAYTHV